jgi:xylan 1,4-beta-xylosidase
MTRFSNPVVKGISPDPSAIRVGDDFYLATSSFDLLPGVTIRHSTDLVNWRIIGHAITRPSQFRRDGEPGPMVLFAPTLRYHDGTFYLACTNAIRGEGNFIVSTTDPTGQWSDALWIDHEGFDPSLFRDEDGTWYYTRRSLQFRPDGNLGPLVQATIDLLSGHLGPLREITAPHGFASNDIEGPHIYKRDGWYYLSAAEGGSWSGHMQTIARSRSVWGPFEPAPHNPILTHRHRVAHRIQTLGHAELLDAPDGSSWALSLGTRHPRMARHHNLGRETFLTPVTWEGGWPHVGTDGTTELQIEDVKLPSGVGLDYAVPDTLWNRGWKTIGAAPTHLDPAAPETLIRLPFGRDLRMPAKEGAPHLGALLKPQTEYDQRFRATVAHSALDAEAGIAAYASPKHCYSLTVSPEGPGRTATFTRTVDDLVTSTVLGLPETGQVTLQIDAHETSYSFSLDVDGTATEVGQGSARLLSAETAQWFTSVSFALIASGPEDSAAALFTDVTVEDIAPGAGASPVPF